MVTDDIFCVVKNQYNKIGITRKIISIIMARIRERIYIELVKNLKIIIQKVYFLQEKP
jgi:hypothetical protein